MTGQVFRTKGGRAADAIRALQAGTRTTAELAALMGIPGRRVYAYLTWAMRAGAVVIVERGEQNRSGKQGRGAIWGIGPTPTKFGEDHRPYKRPPPPPQREHIARDLPVRRTIVPAELAPRPTCIGPASVFEWRP